MHHSLGVLRLKCGPCFFCKKRFRCQSTQCATSHTHHTELSVIAIYCLGVAGLRWHRKRSPPLGGRYIHPPVSHLFGKEREGAM